MLTQNRILTDEQLSLLSRFYQTCDVAVRRSHNEYQLAVNVTRLWNWIDSDGLSSGLQEELWSILAAEFPTLFADSEKTNSLRFTYLSTIEIRVSQTRYSKSGFCLKTESKDGFKTNAHHLIEAAGCYYSHRQGYVASKTQRDVILWAAKNGFSARLHLWNKKPASHASLYFHPFYCESDRYTGTTLTYAQLKKLKRAIETGTRLSAAAISHFAESK